MKLPNAMIIGVQKAGTTSLFDWIGQHPDVLGESSMKDFPFFSDEEHFKKGLDWFSTNFNNGENQKIILHGSVVYIYNSQTVAKRLYNYNNDLKIILVLRNPIERAYSAFWFAKKVNLEPLGTFNEALERERLKENKSDEPILSYIDRGLYYEQIKDYYKYFCKNQVKILIFERMLDNKEKYMKEVFDFLGVDSNFTPSYKKLNSSGAPRFKNINVLWKNLLIQNTFKKILPFKVRFKLREVVYRLNSKKFEYPVLDNETRSRLSSLFEADIAKLEELINEDLSIWK